MGSIKHLYQYCATSSAPAAAMDRVRYVCASESCATAEKYDADRLCVARGGALLKQAAAGGDKVAAKAAADALRELGEAVPPGAP